MAHSSYAPDDAGITLSLLDFLRTPEGSRLRDQVRTLLQHHPHPTVVEISSLRKTYPADAVRAALTLGKLQSPPQRSAKFNLPYFWAVPEAAEQATDHVVAAHKASRYQQRGATRIYDLCAGVGGDTLALANVADVTAVDLSPLRTRCLEFNLHERPPHFSVDLRVGDVRDAVASLHPAAGLFFHIDPARRAAGKRSPRWDDLIPGPAVIADVINHFAGGAVKLSPAVDFTSLPAGHLEIISHNRTVVQAVLWVGAMAEAIDPAERTATVLIDNFPPLSLRYAPQPPAIAPRPADAHALTGLYLYEADGALTRAGTAAPYARDLHLQCLTIDAGYLLGPPGIHSPALIPFEILAIAPFSESRVAHLLQQTASALAIPPGAVEVKTRGALPGIDTDRLQVLWTRSSPKKLTVLLFRWADDVMAVIARRPSRAEESATESVKASSQAPGTPADHTSG